jgi:hypothetical protein
MRHLPLAFVLMLFLMLPVVRHAEASLAPTSVSLSLGYSNGLGPEGNSYTPVPSVSALWSLTGHISVFSAVSYLQERSDPMQYRVFPASGYPYFQAESSIRRSHYVPVAAGIRVSLGHATRSQGLFVEAGPALYLASLESGEEEAVAGLQAGAGVRFHTFGTAHGEIGMSFYRSRGTEAPEDAWSASPDHEGVNAYVLHATIGLSP